MGWKEREGEKETGKGRGRGEKRGRKTDVKGKLDKRAMQFETVTTWSPCDTAPATAAYSSDFLQPKNNNPGVLQPKNPKKIH